MGEETPTSQLPATPVVTPPPSAAGTVPHAISTNPSQANDSVGSVSTTTMSAFNAGRSSSRNYAGRYRGNRRSGGRGRGRGTPQSTRIYPPQRGNEAELIVLSHPSERPSRDQFVVFKHELEQYILKHFTYPDDIVCVIKDMKDPTKQMLGQLPRKSKLTEEFGSLDVMGEDEMEEINEAIKDLYLQDMKLYTTRKQALRHNMVKLYGIIWGNCSHALQTELAAIKGY